MIKIKNIFFVLFFFFSVIVSAQFDSKEIAQVGWLSISEDEFLERIEMTPQFNRQIKNFSSSIKLQFLYTLIAEKLWAIEAENLQLDTSAAVRTAISSIEKLYVRDELFKREIKDKILIPEEKYIEAIIKNSKLYYVRYLFSTNSEEIQSLYSLLAKGESFEELLSNRGENEGQSEPITIYFGDLIESIEDSLYHLVPAEYTKPLIADDGWYIFKLYDIKPNEFSENTDTEEISRSVKKIIEQRIGEKIQGDFYKLFFKNLKVDVNKEMFINISESLSKIFNNKYLIRQENSTNLLTIDAYDVINLKRDLGIEHLQNIFIELSDKPILLDDFIDEFFFDGFQISPESINNLSSILNQKIRIFIERELLAREGYKRNLQNSPEVKKYVRMWKDYYLSQAYLSHKVEAIDVSEKSIKNIYNNDYKDITYEEQVNVAEILVKDINLANKIFTKLVENDDFGKYAKMYSQREWTKNKSGELGFFSTKNLGEIGKVASTLRDNEISKPFKSEGGYSIIKLLGKKNERIQSPSKSFAELKSTIKRKIAFNTLFPKLVDETSEMANEFPIEINVDVLNRLQISNINNFAIRIMGFGGKITAVPLQKPFTEWVDKWINKPNVLP